MAVEPLEGDALHLPGGAQAAEAVGLPRAHHLQQPPRGVGALVVEVAADKVGKVGPLALHIVPPEAAVAGGGAQEQLPQQVRHRLQQPLAVRDEPLVHKARHKAEDLVLPLLADSGLQPGTVEPVQLAREGGHIRKALGAPAQYVHQQGVAPGGPLLQGHHQLGAEKAGLELLRGNTGEIYVVHEHLARHVPSSPSFVKSQIVYTIFSRVSIGYREFNVWFTNVGQRGRKKPPPRWGRRHHLCQPRPKKALGSPAHGGHHQGGDNRLGNAGGESRGHHDPAHGAQVHLIGGSHHLGAQEPQGAEIEYRVHQGAQKAGNAIGRPGSPAL